MQTERVGQHLCNIRQRNFKRKSTAAILRGAVFTKNFVLLSTKQTSSTLDFLIDMGFRREKSFWTDEEKDTVCEFLRKVLYLGEAVIRHKMTLLLFDVK
jgi:hypothetical protein